MPGSVIGIENVSDLKAGKDVSCSWYILWKYANND